MLISVHEQQFIIIILKCPHPLEIRLLPEHRISKLFEFYERLLTGSCQIISRQLKYPLYPDNNSIDTAVQAFPVQLYQFISIMPRRNSTREKEL